MFILLHMLIYTENKTF